MAFSEAKECCSMCECMKASVCASLAVHYSLMKAMPLIHPVVWKYLFNTIKTDNLLMGVDELVLHSCY